MNTYVKKDINSSLVSSQSQENLIIRKRIQSAKLTQILKNKIFKGYNKIKLINSKKFDLQSFLNNNPEDKLLRTSEKYNIYYENKYLKKNKEDSKLIPLKDSLIIKKNKNSRKQKAFFSGNSSLSSITTFSLRKRKKNSFFDNTKYEYDSKRVNINESRQIFENENEKNIFSKYSFLIFDKKPDEINNPKNLRNFLHYKSKNRQKNKNQQHFLFNLSHHKENKVKNLFSLTPRANFKKYKNKSFNDTYKENDRNKLFSFSFTTRIGNIYEINKFIKSIKTERLKKYFIKEKLKKFYKQN